jgi:hypothetical protein
MMKACAAGLCAAILAAAMAVPSADAATKKRTYYTSGRVASVDRPRARIRVAPRSFLDAGTEVQPGERKFTDYAFPASGNAGIGITAVTNIGGKVGWARDPLMEPFQLPGFSPW